MRVNFFSFLSSSAWVGSLSFAFGLVVAPLGASLINRFACRAVSMAGCLACASGLAVASFASSLTLLFVSYAVFGCGSGCVLVSSVVVVRRCLTNDNHLLLESLHLAKVWVQWSSVKSYNLLLPSFIGEIHCGFLPLLCFLTASVVSCMMPT